jgi:hypothetical protein
MKSKFVSYYYNKNCVFSLYLLFKLKRSYLKNTYSLLIINLPTFFNKSVRGEGFTSSKMRSNHLFKNLIISRKSEKYGME